MNHVFTVSEFTSAMKSIIEPNFRSFSVKGEISNFKVQSSGHLYFSLKDAGAQVSAVLFRGDASSLSQIPKDGDQIIARGALSIYAPRGQYQIIVRDIQYLGLGALLLKFHQLKETLQLRGWLDPQRKKPLPKFPKKIGVVTSPSGSVIRDILDVLKRRFAAAHVILSPVRVQGERASQEIAQAINEMNQYELVDLLIVGRGGGSVEDLWAFNEEIVAKAIFESKIPVISAVGHETDFTIADWVADVRAPTPSAAAEIAVAEKGNLLKYLSDARVNFHRRMKNHLLQERQYIFSLKRNPILSSPYKVIYKQMQQLDNARSSLDLLRPSNRIVYWRHRFMPFSERFKGSINVQIREKKERLRALSEHIRSLNPKNLLKKGYSILYLKTNLLSFFLLKTFTQNKNLPLYYMMVVLKVR